MVCLKEIEELTEQVKDQEVQVANEVLLMMLIPCNSLHSAFPLGMIPVHGYTAEAVYEWVESVVEEAPKHMFTVQGFSADNYTSVHRQVISNYLYQSGTVSFIISQFNLQLDNTSLQVLPDIRHLFRCLVNQVTSCKKTIIQCSNIVDAFLVHLEISIQHVL